MIRLLFYYFVFLIEFLANSQNLVPNSSFENYSICPNSGNENIESSLNWYNPTAYSPDYYNSCATDIVYGQSVPNNGFGYQPAKSGVAYAGLITMIETDGREYIQTTLTDSLTAGVTYTVKFYVSAADSSPYAANNIGAYFSNNPVSSGDSWYLPFTPQIKNDSSANPLDDRYGWTEVSGSFIAQGGEKFITIGNFNNDLNTDTTFHSDGSTWLSFSYHYIDDVSVTDSTLSLYEEFNQSQISVYPNPSYGNIHIKSTEVIEELQVYSSLGQLVLSQSPKTKDFKVDLSSFEDGMYYITLQFNESTITKKIIINR